jgi:hypothetical protein
VKPWYGNGTIEATTKPAFHGIKINRRRWPSLATCCSLARGHAALKWKVQHVRTRYRVPAMSGCPAWLVMSKVPYDVNIHPTHVLASRMDRAKLVGTAGKGDSRAHVPSIGFDRESRSDG